MGLLLIAIILIVIGMAVWLSIADQPYGKTILIVGLFFASIWFFLWIAYKQRGIEYI